MRSTSAASACLVTLSVGIAFVLAPAPSQAGGPFRRTKTVVGTPIRTTATTVVRPDNANAPTPMLGSFYATPYVTIRGDSPTGGGYSPLGQYGPANLAMYGPLSVYRSTSVPTPVYARGYDGAVVLTEGTAFSQPNLPESSPYVNPTPAAYRDRARPYPVRRSWPSAINWLDQN